jgi:protein-S-isoprenylcysteine O-methyltransferase Ste14
MYKKHNKLRGGTMNLSKRPLAIITGQWLFKHRGLQWLLLLPCLSFFAEVEWAIFTWSLGLGLMLLGGMLRLWSISFIGRSARTRQEKAKQLIIDGPFALCRNPIYLGNMVAMSGFVVLSEVLWYVPFFLILSFSWYSFIVRYEEYVLLDKFPNEYSAYLKSVPRWVPCLSKEALNKPVYGLREVVFREKNLFRVKAILISVALCKEIFPVLV